jgi:hypothetical protein
MLMKKALFLLVLLSFSAEAVAKKTTYIVSNKRFNYVKLKEISVRKSEQLSMSHPVELDIEKLSDLLASIELSKRHLISAEDESVKVFDKSAIDFLAPHLKKAFSTAKANERVTFAYLTKNPRSIFRNDRLSIVQAWFSNGKLYMKFKKLYAQVHGDINKRGNEAKIAARSRGLRVSFELRPGLTMLPGDSKTLVADLSGNFKAGSDELLQAVKSGSTDKVKSKQPKKSQAAADNALAESAKKQNAKDRLQVLEELKREKLITKKEYEEKRKKILNEL